MEEVDHVCINSRLGELIRFRGLKYIWRSGTSGTIHKPYIKQRWNVEYLRLDNSFLLQTVYGVEQDEIDYMFSINL